MYSYEDRIRAVKLYIKLNKRITATIIHLNTRIKFCPNVGLNSKGIIDFRKLGESVRRL